MGYSNASNATAASPSMNKAAVVTLATVRFGIGMARKFRVPLALLEGMLNMQMS